MHVTQKHLSDVFFRPKLEDKSSEQLQQRIMP